MRSQPLFGIGRGLEQIADVVLDAQRQQDDIDLKQQAVLLDNRLDELKEEIKEEPDFAKRDELYRTRAAEYLQETTGQISSQRVKQGLNQYYSIKFPREALKTKGDNQKEWGEHRVAQTDALGDLMADRITNTDDPREVQKYQALYKDQLDSLSIGPYAPLNAIRRQNMEQAFNVKVLDRRAKRMIGQNAYGFMVAADEGQFDSLPDLEKYRSMATNQINREEQATDRINKDISDTVRNRIYALANNGQLSPEDQQALLNGESRYVTAKEAETIVNRNNNPLTGGGSQAVQTIQSEYYLGARSIPRINATLQKLQALQRELITPNPAINKFANELQSDRTTMENQGIARESNEIQRQNREIGHLKTDYEAEKRPMLKEIEGLFGNMDTANKAKIEAEYRRSGYEAAKRLKDSLAKGQKAKADSLPASDKKVLEQVR